MHLIASNMSSSPIRIAPCVVLLVVGLTLVLGLAVPSVAQDKDAGQDTRESLAEQIVRLDDPNYRLRSLASWKLGRNPRQSIPLIRSAISTAKHNAGTEMVELLMLFVVEGEALDSKEALAVLQTTSKRLNSVGRLAQNALYTIASLNEKKAIELLLHHDAKIGPRRFSLNGRLGEGLAEDALHIDSEFSGDKECVQKMRYIRSISTVCFEGEKIDRSFLESLVEMEGVENIKLKNVNLTADDLKLLQSMDSIEHLGLLYMDVGDEVVEVLKQLPLSNSLKVYGTEVTSDGFAGLQRSLDDLEMIYGRGGFLGVSPLFLSGTQIRRVTLGSAAEKAGILPQDILREVEGVEITTFADLRKELGKYKAGKKLTIKLDRMLGGGSVEREFEVVLQEE